MRESTSGGFISHEKKGSARVQPPMKKVPTPHTEEGGVSRVACVHVRGFKFLGTESYLQRMNLLRSKGLPSLRKNGKCTVDDWAKSIMLLCVAIRDRF